MLDRLRDYGFTPPVGVLKSIRWLASFKIIHIKLGKTLQEGTAGKSHSLLHVPQSVWQPWIHIIMLRKFLNNWLYFVTCTVKISQTPVSNDTRMSLGVIFAYLSWVITISWMSMSCHVPQATQPVSQHMGYWEDAQPDCVFNKLKRLYLGQKY